MVRIAPRRESNDRYRLLLGLDDAWRVDSVDLSLDAKRVEIRLEHRGGLLTCPECQSSCPQADRAPERPWRHLDTMQFETVLRARIPRCQCAQCGVKTMAVPWADKHSRFTLMFEALAIHGLQACNNVSRAASLLRVDWHTAHELMERAVARGLERRQVEHVTTAGIDEKSFGKGQSYVSVLVDNEGHRVLEVVEGRTEESADRLWASIPEKQRETIEAVSMDMWPAFMASTKKNAPSADIVFDRFHIAKHLNEAVDQVRRQENKVLRRDGDDRLTGTKPMWLFNPENLPERYVDRFESLKQMTLKTSRAWAIKDNFRHFWDYVYTGAAERFFGQWYSWAVRSQLSPIIAKAKMIKRHLPDILTYFKHLITNAVSEGFNSKVQSIKSNARGFLAFENYRTRILFYCGSLDMLPSGIAH